MGIFHQMSGFLKRLFRIKSNTDKSYVKYLIIGLGNIGEEYQNTRHNIGFDVLDRLANQQGCTFRSDMLGDVCSFKYRGRAVYLLKPSTYMNLSGKAVRYWTQKLKISPTNWLILVDEFQFDIGVFKLQKKGSPGGHNGLKSIQDLMQTSVYPRVRIGIGHDFHRGQQTDYVLGKWNEEQWNKILPVIDEVCDLVRSYVAIGLEKSMNQFNKKKSEPKL